MLKQCLLLACLLCTTLLSAASEAPAIAAASSVQAALSEIAAQFKTATGYSVRLAFGSSGNFYRQIRQGAPFELFLSADEGFAQQLVEADLTEGESVCYATGQLVLFTPQGSTLKLNERVDDAGVILQTALAQGLIERFAIANPNHAPYGRAAQHALESLGVWASIKPKLVLGENVAQAAQFAISGSTQGGLFAHSLALSPAVQGQGQFLLLPQRLYPPLRQGMVLLKSAGETARLFHDYIQQAPARAVFEQYGFSVNK